MKIPFSSPRLVEIETMTADSKADILRRYAESAAAHKLVRTVKMMLFTAVLVGVGGFMVAGMLCPSNTVVRLGSVALAGCLVVSAVAYYRKASETVLRQMAHDSKKQDER